ncbi:GNAT family N-acetyltransferase [Streptomyces sp. ITFR-16]|uniref:GNAT family N-acetyltransferase n=1 Tax=Streptomyces sp. ITFR-16 TaxID=3075198 RepID=UPI00288A63CB|nr:GNAT family N-acetyltransferase [Streptomyces sp. ITFR-16]WNI20613.1 GNAT family N-acetyltransferase [Streptomyces sp. ITFR-16]
MTDLRIVRVDDTADDSALVNWRHVHNTIIPTAVLSHAETAERARRNRLAVACLDEVTVGCSTVRPPAPGSSVATVIARVLPEYRGRGFGEQVYARALAEARELGAEVIETCVLETNPEGLRFARARGFTETERYVLPGDTVAFIDLRLA